MSDRHRTHRHIAVIFASAIFLILLVLVLLPSKDERGGVEDSASDAAPLSTDGEESKASEPSDSVNTTEAKAEASEGEVAALEKQALPEPQQGIKIQVNWNFKLIDTTGDGKFDSVDSDDDGKADFAAADIDGDLTPDFLDLNQDGTANASLFDETGDGMPDTIDRDLDGKPDGVLVDLNGDGMAESPRYVARIKLCHRSAASRGIPETIEIDTSAISGYLKRGASIGECSGSEQ